MTSSNKEILEAFAPLMKMGVVGVDTGVNEGERTKNCEVKYNKLATFGEVMASREIEGNEHI